MKKTQSFIPTLLCCFLCLATYGQKTLIKENHTFTENMIGWEKGTWGDARSEPEARIIIDNNDGHDDKASIKVLVDKATKDNPSKIFLLRKGIKLKKGKTYTISFWAKSRVADDSVRLLIYSSEETGSKKEWGGVVERDLRFLGDGTWQQLSYTFEAKDKFPGAPADLGDLGISIGFGSRRGEYHIDNFKLVKID